MTTINTTITTTRRRGSIPTLNPSGMDGKETMRAEA
jgi:hypothetical protein